MNYTNMFSFDVLFTYTVAVMCKIAALCVINYYAYVQMYIKKDFNIICINSDIREYVHHKRLKYYTNSH